MANKNSFDINEMAIFVEVVNAQSFTGAANNLGLPNSTISL
jgi:DNA-binding transcriptional LysR family regulator